MVPIETGRLLGRDPKTVFEGRIARANRCFEDLVLMTPRWNGESVKMQVSGAQFHGPARASVHGARVCTSVGGCARLDFIPKAQDQQVPRVQSQGWRLGAAA